LCVPTPARAYICLAQNTMNGNPKIDEYIASKAEFAQPILNEIRTRVHALLPEVEETIKWNSMCFEYKGLLCSCAAFKQHCVFGFWKYQLMRSAFPELDESDKTMYQVGRITTLKEMPTKAQMKKWIQYAIMLNEKGISTKRIVSKKDASVPLTMPLEFDKALRKDKIANANFEAMPPSHKKEFIEWIAEAKRDATKQARVVKALMMLHEKKDLNYKYRK
jgi:uncharacterized protein YdeI (YjbR/CyaY-like superfamily)